MTTNEPFGAAVDGWLREDALNRVPDHLAAVLDATRATRQRPWWSSLERWRSMDVSLPARTYAPPRLGRVLAVVALLVALLGVVAWAAGSRAHRLPAPFGPARNGSILSWDPGDIYVSAADGSDRRLLVGGDTTDFGPYYTRGGTKFIFWRNVGYDASLPMLANSDGTGIQPMLDSPLVNPNGFDWAPSDDRLAVVHVVGDNRVMSIVSVGSLTPQRVPLPDNVVPNFDAQWRAPDGHEIVFTEQGTSTHGGGLDAVHPDGSGFRQILPPPDHDFYQGLELAPDGKTATYWTTDAPSATGADGHAHVHVVDLETGVDHRVVFGSPDADEAEFTHSPDGTAGLLVRTEAGASTVLLVQLVGSAPPRSLSERFLPTGEKTAFFSPDGRTAIIHFDTTRPRFVDIATGVTRTADAPVGRIGGWQRLPLTP